MLKALRNAERHSGALSVQVVLEQTRDAIRLSVSDNGAGFDPNRIRLRKAWLYQHERTLASG
jgi:signal transduction histidine kinase